MDYSMYVIDGILLLVLILTIIRCAVLGLTRGLAGIVAWIVASFVALYGCAPLSEMAYERFAHERVQAQIQDNIQTMTEADEITVTVKAVMEEIPEFISNAAKSVGVDTENLVGKTEIFDPENIAETMEENLCRPIIQAALKVVFFFVILILLSGLLMLLLHPIGKAIHHLPVIGKADKSLGAVLGVLKGVLLVAVLAMTLQVAASIAEDSEFTAMVDNSKIVSFVSQSPFADGLFR